MAIAVLFTPEKMNRDNYEAVRETADAAFGMYPPGRLHHYCFGAGDQLRVLDIWDSAESLGAFAQVLMPTLAGNGVVMPPPDIQPLQAERSLGYIARLRAAHEAFSAGDLDTAETLVAPVAKFTDHGRNLSSGTRAEFRGWLESHKAMSSDMHIVDAQYTAGDSWVTARFRAVGTQDGPLGPFPPSGKPFSIEVCEVWHFNDEGQSDEGHDYSDAVGVMVQLGHLSLGEL